MRSSTAPAARTGLHEVVVQSRAASYALGSPTEPNPVSAATAGWEAPRLLAQPGRRTIVAVHSLRECADIGTACLRPLSFLREARARTSRPKAQRTCACTSRTAGNICVICGRNRRVSSHDQDAVSSASLAGSGSSRGARGAPGAALHRTGAAARRSFRSPIACAVALCLDAAAVQLDQAGASSRGPLPMPPYPRPLFATPQPE
jgi:hypothetical protein